MKGVLSVAGCLIICLLRQCETAPSVANKNISPVILVPGDGGSQFEARLDKPSVQHIFCTYKTENWYSLWLNLELLGPYILDCFVDNMKLTYDPVTRTTKNQPGVEIRQPGFGNSSSVEWLDSSQLGATSYFYHIVESLVKDLGYKRNVTVRGAPYDFRKAPNEMADYLSALKNLVEDTYAKNNEQPVVLMGHSMGNLYILYLLNHQPQAWKDKYIRSFISIAGPYGGAVKTLRLMASGDNLGVFVVNPLTARQQQRTMPSTSWLLPYDSFWAEDEVLVHGPSANYTVRDYKKFFDDIKYPDGYSMRQDTEELIKNLEAPGVEVHCIHGVNVSTPAALSYSKSKSYEKQPDVITGDGDGTVNVRSLQGCQRWIGKQKEDVFYHQVVGAEHLAILNNAEVKAYIAKVLSS